MPTTPEAAQVAARHRIDQLAVRAGAVRELVDLWRIVDPENLGGTINPFARQAAALARRRFIGSAEVAAEFYAEYRAAEGVSGAAVAAVAAPVAAEIVAADLRGAALKGIIDGRRRGMTLDGAAQIGFVKTTGALIKQVLTGGRMTLIDSVQKDPVALGWARATDGDPCAFCRVLASRGAVYKTKKAADFEAHGDCACTPEPLYPGEQLDTGWARQSATYLAEYKTAQAWARLSGTMSKGTSNDALNNYRRWLANGSPEPGGTTLNRGAA